VISDRGCFSALHAEGLITYHSSLITRFGIALRAGKSLANGLGSTFGRGDPRAVDPWRLVPHMLLVPALEPGHPMAFVVLAKADDAAIRHVNVRVN
jgi:hypothetical protein